jgi:hypothetical protein
VRAGVVECGGKDRAPVAGGAVVAKVREALPLGANVGGLDELLIPNPEVQIALEGVFGVNPPF